MNDKQIKIAIIIVALIIVIILYYNYKQGNLASIGLNPTTDFNGNTVSDKNDPDIGRFVRSTSTSPTLYTDASLTPVDNSYVFGFSGPGTYLNLGHLIRKQTINGKLYYVTDAQATLNRTPNNELYIAASNATFYP